MKRDYTKTLLGILALLFGLLALFYGTKYYQAEETSETYLAEKNEINEEYDALVSEFEVLNNEIELLETSNNDLYEEVDSQKRELISQRDKISRLLRKEQLTRSELAQARAMIDDLRALKQELTARVDKLSAENTALKNENRTYSETITRVAEEKKDLEKKNDSLTATTKQLEEEKVQLVEEHHKNSDKVAFAQVVPVKNIIAEGVKYKNSGREKPTNNFKQVDKLAITFTIENNPVADSGNKEYLVRVISPDGTVVYDPQRGSGQFLSTPEQQGMKYTTSTVVNYNQKEKQVSLFWRQDRPYQKGNYLVEVYQQGYKVGESSFELKGGFL